MPAAVDQIDFLNRWSTDGLHSIDELDDLSSAQRVLARMDDPAQVRPRTGVTAIDEGLEVGELGCGLADANMMPP